MSLAATIAEESLSLPAPANDGSELEIYSDNVLTDLCGIQDVLGAISEIYSEAATLLGVSSLDEPIQIIKIESGSLSI